MKLTKDHIGKEVKTAGMGEWWILKVVHGRDAWFLRPDGYQLIYEVNVNDPWIIRKPSKKTRFMATRRYFK